MTVIKSIQIDHNTTHITYENGVVKAINTATLTKLFFSPFRQYTHMVLPAGVRWIDDRGLSFIIERPTTKFSMAYRGQLYVIPVSRTIWAISLESKVPSFATLSDISVFSIPWSVTAPTDELYTVLHPTLCDSTQALKAWKMVEGSYGNLKIPQILSEVMDRLPTLSPVGRWRLSPEDMPGEWHRIVLGEKDRIKERAYLKTLENLSDEEILTTLSHRPITTIGELTKAMAHDSAEKNALRATTTTGELFDEIIKLSGV